MFRSMLTLPLCALALLAQPAPPQAPPVQALKQYLSLADEQVTQLTQLRREQARAVQPVAQQTREKRVALRTLLEGGTADSATVGRAVLDLDALRKQFRQIDERYQAQARQILTAAQKEKLEALADAAKLQPAIRQAAGLNLIDRPAPGGPRPAGEPGGGPPLD